MLRGDSALSNRAQEWSIGLARARNKRIPGPSALAWHTGETAARRRVGNIDEVITRWTLNLPAGELHLTFQVLLAMRALKFKFARSHNSEWMLTERNQWRQNEMAMNLSPQLPALALQARHAGP